jgi:Raf kinase inhibitor-like YbhB/YbcL family protein
MKNIMICFFSSLLLLSSPAFAEDAAPQESESKAEPMSLTTNGFLDKMAMPTLYTCDGKDVSPKLMWSNLPTKTVTLALVMKDIDAPDGDFYHWIVFNIPKNMTELDQGAPAPAGANFGLNSFTKATYSGPCPPKGTAHTYIFTLYALDSKITLPKDANGPALIAALKNHIISQVELTGVYSRWIQ